MRYHFKIVKRKTTVLYQQRVRVKKIDKSASLFRHLSYPKKFNKKANNIQAICFAWVNKE